MLIQKKKSNKLIITPGESGYEIESFTLLRASKEEVSKILEAANIAIQYEALTEPFTLDCKKGDSIDVLFNKFALAHSKNNVEFKSVTKKYVPHIEGTSMLIRDIKNQVIKIALRKGTSCNINKLFISNETRTRFFKDTRMCSYLPFTGKYGIDRDDEMYYRKWCLFMDGEYFKNIENRYE